MIHIISIQKEFRSQQPPIPKQILVFSDQIVIESSFNKKRIHSQYQNMYKGYSSNPHSLIFGSLLGLRKISWISLVRNKPFSNGDLEKARLYFPWIIACFNARLANISRYLKLVNLAQEASLTDAEFRLLWTVYVVLCDDPSSLCYDRLNDLQNISNSAAMCSKVAKKITGKTDK